MYVSNNSISSEHINNRFFLVTHLRDPIPNNTITTHKESAKERKFYEKTALETLSRRV